MDSLAFGPFVLDAARGTLLRDGVAQPLGRRALAVLGVLVRTDGEPVTGSELLDRAWPGLVVAKSNLSVQIAALSRNASFAHRKHDRDTRRITAALGVRYLVQGGMRRTGERLRVDCRLIDGTSDRQLWGVSFTPPSALSYCVKSLGPSPGRLPRQGHRDSVVAIICASSQRIVATESGTCRRVRRGRAARRVVLG